MEEAVGGGGAGGCQSVRALSWVCTYCTGEASLDGRVRSSEEHLRGTVRCAGWCAAGFGVLGKPSWVSRKPSVGSEQMRDSLTYVIT